MKGVDDVAKIGASVTFAVFSSKVLEAFAVPMVR